LFLVLIAFVIVALAASFVFKFISLLTVLIVILIFLLVMYTQVNTFFAQLREYERAVVFRFGKFNRVVGPGWYFFFPFVETYERVELRIRTIDIKAQDVITKDNIKLKLDAIIYLKVKDPKAAILNVEDYEASATSYVQASIRDVIGKTPLSDAIAKVDQINIKLKEELRNQAKHWGVEVESVEIQDIQLPENLQTAMHERSAAEQRKYAAKEMAEGKKITIEAIQEAAGKLTNPSLQYLYLQALEKVAEGKSNKIIFPLELSKLASGLSAKLGESLPRAQEELSDKYEELRREGKAKDAIIDALRKEYGLSKEKPKKRR